MKGQISSRYFSFLIQITHDTIELSYKSMINTIAEAFIGYPDIVILIPSVVLLHLNDISIAMIYQ